MVAGVRAIAPLRWGELARVTGGYPLGWSLVREGDRAIAGITTDSRQVRAGEAFVALRGENFDGHGFVATARDRGAAITLVERPMLDDQDKPLLPQVVVGNGLTAYQALGRAWRSRFEIPIVAITGSVGKTSTKECLAAVLGTAGAVHKTYGNFNNEIGVPKTLLQLDGSHDFAVVEMAMRGRGQIAELARMAVPTVGVITNVGTAHIGLLGSEQAIAEAKCELLAELPPGAIAVLNGDDERLMATAAQVWSGETVTYGLRGGDLRGDLTGDGAIVVAGERFPLPLAGRHHALNFLAALAVARVVGVPWEPLKGGLAIALPEGRARRLTLAEDIEILDETYNAGLESMLAALDLLAETRGTRRLAVLGTMKELGDRAAEFHHRVGQRARELALDGLLVMADEPVAREMATGAAGIPCECFDDREALTARIKAMLRPGDRWLFKASHSVALDRVVQAIAAVE
ncbi:MAG: UDP-N-acetylmuramoyl-tripeptide--D-alanyl-D-alanine ligase [Cyanophyceae cyanobacterium]